MSDIVGSFKTGNAYLAFPLAAGILDALRIRGLLTAFDAIVPVPLSPDKAELGELDRTLALATELGRLVDTSVRQLLRLKEPVSKRRMLAQGYTYRQFERKYLEALEVESYGRQYSSLLLVDDVSTHGGTASACVDRLLAKHPGSKIIVAAAAQMIVKPAVRDESGLRVP